MYALQQARQEIIQSLKAAIGKGYTPTVDELEIPRVTDLGDFAFPCFGMAKGLKRNPVEIASELAPKIAPEGVISRVESKGPYVNFYLDTTTIAEMVLEEISHEGYGRVKEAPKKKIMVEFAQPNTHKEVHVGHLRNALVGQGVVNVLRANGFEVVPTSYINDLGAHVAKCLWAIQKFHPDEEPGKEERNAFLGKVYTEASVWLEEHPDEKEEVQKIFQSLEEGHRGWISLWKKTKKWSMDVIKGIFAELGLTIEQWYFESDLLDRSRTIIENLLQKKIAVVSDGAVIVNLEDKKLGVNLLRRTDGTLLYNAKDLALAYQKEDDHHPDVSLYVIDVRQSLAMQQLFATLQIMGFKEKLVHLSYELVTLPEGAMSSRKGNIVKYEELRDALMKASEEGTSKRHPDWSDKKVKDVSQKLAFAAMKFMILKHDLDKVVVFHITEALSFDGFTGPYCLYTLARIESIFRKAPRGSAKGGATGATFSHKTEAALIRKIAEFPDLVRRLGNTYQLSVLAQYAFELAKTFSEFYHEVSVLQAETPALVASRLELCRATSVTLRSALALLGIEPVKEM